MYKIEKTSRRIIKVWWAFMWRTMLIMMIAGMIVGIPAAFIFPSSKYDYRIVSMVLNLVSLLIFIPVSIKVMGRILDLSYSDFHLAFLANEDSGATNNDKGPSEQ